MTVREGIAIVGTAESLVRDLRERIFPRPRHEALDTQRPIRRREPTRTPDQHRGHGSWYGSPRR